MSESHKTDAILLLSAHFSAEGNETVKPLTISEWKRFAGWLRKRDMNPWDLMTGNIHEQLEAWSDTSITVERLERLLSRGTALAFAMDKWTSAGLWVLTREDYPKRFKQRLGVSAPIVLYGFGNKALLKDGGLAVIGSRNAVDEDLAYSSGVGALAAQNGLPVVSGGARGVDKYAMHGALLNNGNVIGVLADNLLRESSSLKYRKHLIEERLVLISSSAPDASFNVGNAMQRNKYIYCLSDMALVVCSGKKGGTWNGAKENLKQGWVSLLVKKTIDKKTGNSDIVERGGEWAPQNINDTILKVQQTNGSTDTRPDKPQIPQAVGVGETRPTDYQVVKQSSDQNENDSLPKTEIAGSATNEDSTALNVPTQSLTDDEVFYEVFISKVKVLCKDNPKTPEQLAEIMQLQKTQLNSWLKRAVEEQNLEKLKRPKVRYRWNSSWLFAESSG